MIKFFRTIRYDLLKENRIGKYIKYALGEIILVVIGILIALSINNWNESRKSAQFEQDVLVDLKDEFEKNKEKLEFIENRTEASLTEMTVFLKFLQQTDHILSNNFTYDELVEAHSSPGGLRTFNPIIGVLNSLVNSGQINKIKNPSLKYKLTSWKDISNDFIEDNQLYLIWYEDKYASYMADLPKLNGQYGTIFSEKKDLLKFYTRAYTDFKYLDLISTAEFSLKMKHNQVSDLLEECNAIIDGITNELSE